MHRAILALALVGCSGTPERLLVVDGTAGEYGLVEAVIPELTDPRRMRGTLGDGVVGGYLDGDLDLRTATVDNVRFRGGGPIEVDWVLEDGVAVPLDADGIALWSFYNTLSEVGPELAEAGYDASPLFPVPFAFQPSLGGQSIASTNAAYVGYGAHLFVVLPDPRSFRLPLAANPGVIRHEFGHAVFQDVVGGGPFAAAEHILDPHVASLNEGFADIVATLTLDDPDFFSASLDGGELDRDVRENRSTAAALDVELDPYSRGSVYASLAWDLREETDPTFALSVAIEALRSWTDAGHYSGGLGGIDRYATLLVDEALGRDAGLRAALCTAHAGRFPDAPTPNRCR